MKEYIAQEGLMALAIAMDISVYMERGGKGGDNASVIVDLAREINRLAGRSESCVESENETICRVFSEKTQAFVRKCREIISFCRDDEKEDDRNFWDEISKRSDSIENHMI